MTKRIALIGAESTGKTTLAEELADHFGTVWVPEYARGYCEKKFADGDDVAWETDEFTHIAAMQQHDEDAVARNAGPIMFCDTDALATTVWHRRYLTAASPAVERLAGERTYAAYVLTGAEMPFVQDGWRDSEHFREWMTGEFRTALASRSEPWIEVHGDRETRLRTAVEFVERVVGPAWLPGA